MKPPTRLSPPRLPALFFACIAAAAPLLAQTTIRVTDEVLVPEISRIGLHYSGGNAFESPVEKRPLEMNFEGTFCRLLVSIDQLDGNRAFTTTLSPHTDSRRSPFLDIFKGATYRVLSGPDQWKTGKIVDITQDTFVNPNTQKEVTAPVLILDEPFTMLPRSGWHSNGLMLETTLRGGSLGRYLIWRWKQNPDLQFYRGFDISEEIELVQGDTAPETYGESALALLGTRGRQYFRADLQTIPPYPERWRLSVWAKKRAGYPVLELGIAGIGKKLFPLDKTWRRYEAEFTVPPGQSGSLIAEFGIDGGDALIDDTVADILDDKNPTVFRDELVNLLKEHRPGVMRLLHNTAGTAELLIRPALQSQSLSGSSYGSFYHRKPGHHEFYELCEEIGADVWANLPGTLTPEDMRFYLEWLNGPTSTPGGALRARLGRERPWTEAFKHIYIEIGNEVITFGGLGYSGPDYWRSLIQAGKDSPHHSPKLEFVVEMQPSSRDNLLKTPNGDMIIAHNYNISPGLWQDEIDRFLNTDEKLAKFVLASPFWKWARDPKYAPDSKWGVQSLSQEFSKPIAIYEGGNYHTTHGDAPEAFRNKFIVGAVGGLSMANHMLALQKNHRVRVQNHFNLFGHSFTGFGAFGDGATIRLWGQVLNPMDPAQRRYRPAYLGVTLANQIIDGDLVASIHEGEDPTFSATGLFANNARHAHIYQEKFRDLKDTFELPILHSYAYKTAAGKRGLIVVNYDLEQTRRVTLALPSGEPPRPARRLVLVSDGLWANNEPESPQPGVRIEESRVESFGDGATIEVPPYSMVGYEW
jgi:hypothetical protein